jgi:seryl-tRNA synthetase
MTMSESTVESGPLADDTAAPDDLECARRALRDRLIEAALLIPMGRDGLYGRSGEFESIIEGIDHSVRRASAAAHGDHPRVVRFPPVLSLENFEKTDYIASFPNLSGAVSTFEGDDKAHRALLADREAGRPWDGHLAPAGTMLASAACQPLYATLAGTLGPDGALVDVYSYCFRHEPSIDPARMQAFRMHEIVYVGEASKAEQHRDSWLPRGLELLADLGLEATPMPANDPFFGRAGRILTANQLAENLKTELVVRLYGDLGDGTAVASGNCHRQHYGASFGITTADGEVAHSACAAFGMERIALALLSTHGTNVAGWPASVRAALAM